MSGRAVKWALNTPVKHAPAKQVLTVLAHYESDGHMTSFASTTTLVANTGQDRKTVLANLRRLQELGFIQDTGERVGSTKSVIVWRLVEPPSGPNNGTTKQSQNTPCSDVPNPGPLSSTEFATASPPEAVPVSQSSGPNSYGKLSQFPPEAVPVFPTEGIEGKERGEKPEGGARAPERERTSAHAPARAQLTLIAGTDVDQAAEESDMTDTKRGTRLPADWQLRRSLGVWAMAEVPEWTEDDVRRQAEAFRDHWVAVPGKAGLKLDWDATWRNWVRNERKWASERAGRRASPGKSRPGLPGVRQSPPSNLDERERIKAAAKRRLFGNGAEVIDV
ncbi:hypothetical protein [Pigmentiphaga daeguensis]|uniref:Helix-turn-helix domain-containing protein n=1 Tax=Pigmentiphaga daeguensis TaxID=414049 RepID=A0ABN1D660_9BURK